MRMPNGVTLNNFQRKRHFIINLMMFEENVQILTLDENRVQLESFNFPNF